MRFGNTIFKFLIAALLLTSGAAMAQRTDTNPEQPQSDHKVIVGGSVFGGGNEANVKGSCSVLITQPGCRVNTDVYGGGALADVNVTETVTGTGANTVTTYSYTSGKTTTVDILEGTISGDIYGGGLGRIAVAAVEDDPITPEDESQAAISEIRAKVYGPVTVNIGSGIVDGDGYATSVLGKAVIGGAVFGGNNINGSPLDNVFVNIYKTAHNNLDTVTNFSANRQYAIDSVFGGGNRANYLPAMTGKKTTVHVYTCNNTIRKVYGGGNAADVGDGDANVSSATEIRIDGGRMEWVFGGGNGAGNHTDPASPNYNPGANVYGDVTVTFHAGDIQYFFGGSNELGNITGDKIIEILNDVANCITDHENHIGELYGGNNKAPASSGMSLSMPCQPNPCKIDYVFGGSRDANIGTEQVPANVELTINGGNYDYVFGGNNLGGTIYGNVTLNLYGGTISHAAYGGNKGGGSITGNITVKVEDQCACPLQVQDVFGAGDQAMYTAPTGAGAREYNPIVYVNNLCTIEGIPHTITGNVYGGGNGNPANADQEPGMVTGNPQVIIGDLTDGHESYRAAISGNVYGGGNAAKVVGTTTVLMQKDNSTVGLDIYGGGNLAHVSGSTIVDIDGGTVSQDVYGGGALANTGGSIVTLTGGTVRDIYGGGLGDATHPAAVNGAVQVTVNGGTVNDVFGCNNVKGAPQSTVQVNINNNVGRNVYGGGNLANCEVSPTVYINKGVVGGSVFGGGLGASAIVAGSPIVTVGDLSVGHEDYVATVTGDVYGGGDLADVRGKTTVLVQKCNTVINGDVYGGGNAAHVLRTETNTLGTTDVTVTGGIINNYVEGHGMVFGGGHGDKDANPPVAANVAVGTNVTINGGTIYQVYGGSNSLGSINEGRTGGINVLVNKASDACDLHINEVYGGGNFAASQAGSIDIECTGTGDSEGITYVYGGANRADVTGPIELTIDEGRINYVFGGNNNDGSITGGITVNIEKKDNPCVWQIGDVFGGGNQAQYSNSGSAYPEVNILNGLVSGDVFGGGLGSIGDKGKVTGNPQVTVNGANASVAGGVYGGGSLAPTAGNPVVTLTDGALTNVFGGGKAANVNGTPTVNINGGTVSTGVYGGCNEKGNVSGKITVNVTDGVIGTSANLQLETPVVANVFGGGYGGYVNESNPGTTTSGDVEVNVSGGTIYGDVYGGSAFGTVNDDGNDKTTVNISGGILETEVGTENGFPSYTGGNVYGGGLGEAGEANAGKGQVNGKVFVNIGSGDLNGSGYAISESLSGSATIKGNIYGCNNTNGSPRQNVVVSVYKTSDYLNSDGYALHNVFGGGNKANFMVTGMTATVNIYGCNNTIERTFGGSNAAASNDVFTMIQGGHIHEAYGGGNGEVTPADIHGNVNLAIHGGNVDQSFGGSNQQGTISGSSDVTIDSEGGCGDSEIDEFFCGGNFADFYGDIDAVIRCADGLYIHNLYGGCKQADVLPTGTKIGNVHLVVEGGIYDNIFGGSQGRLAGTSTLYPDAESADINGSILLEIHGGKVNNAIYGGSHILGAVKGTITVNIEDKILNDDCELDLSIAEVYGGGNEADYPGLDENGNPITHTAPFNYPQINIKNATVKNVFGGGYKAKVTGNPQITLKKQAKILGNVYGGGNMGEVDGSPKVVINGKDDSENPHTFPN